MRSSDKGERSEKREMNWNEEEGLYWKVKGKFLFLLFHIFLWPRISNFPRARWCWCSTGQLPATVYTTRPVCQCLFVNFTEIFLLHILPFFMFSQSCCKIFPHTCKTICMYILNPIFWRTWKPHSKAAGNGGWKNFYIHTHFLTFFFFLCHPSRSIRERKT